MSDRQILDALECCTEFLCDVCPYKQYDIQEHPLRCINRLMNDLYQMCHQIRKYHSDTLGDALGGHERD